MHDAAGRETERHIGAEVTLTQSWSAVGLLTAQTLTATSASLVSGADRLLQHRTYAHQADGCVTEIRELTSGTRRFDLDGMAGQRRPRPRLDGKLRVRSGGQPSARHVAGPRGRR